MRRIARQKDTVSWFGIGPMVDVGLSAEKLPGVAVCFFACQNHMLSTWNLDDELQGRQAEFTAGFELKGND